MSDINWYIVNKDYIAYLKKYDNRVENVDYNKSLKPYLGIVLEINEFKYYVPISSPKKKHYQMKQDIDFIKIKNNKNEILGVLNLNNMVPILDTQIEKLKYSKINEYRDFKTNEEKENYISLLKIELKIINSISDKIRKNANKIYKIRLNNSYSKISKRTCDFKLLEDKAKEY